ncbi:MAG: hypothetical protein D6B25_12080 [Desulfobulbaceae bacterium]|nr:MAG: hypothetical protein D6B25_12080 [Desulfobulbaceae bacterium]
MDQEKAPQRRVGRGSSTKTLILIGFVLLIALLFGGYYYQSVDSEKNSVSGIVDPPRPTGNTDIIVPGIANQNNQETHSPPPVSINSNNNTQQATVSSGQIIVTDLSKPDDAPVTPLPVQTQQQNEQQQCAIRAENIKKFFNHLDEQQYIQNFSLDEPSSIYFPKLIQRLIDNPPVVSGETDDLYTVLQNTAHFFRIIGKRNIFVLKGILDREKDSFEEVLVDFYLIAVDGNCLTKELGITMPDNALYLYSGFFLNTMGGRLYLFRRDSMSRMIVSYYAIMIIDQSNRTGKNKFGIDISAPIDSLIAEIESSNVKLKLRDEYLDKLYDLKVRYQ